MKNFKSFAAIAIFLTIAFGLCTSAMVAVMRLVIIAITCGVVAVQ